MAMMTVAILGLLSWDAPVAQAANCGATQPGPLLLGCNNNTATDTTVLKTSTIGIPALQVSNTAQVGTGVQGKGGVIGVQGTGGQTGVSGTGSNVGVAGDASNVGVSGIGSNVGVAGIGNSFGVTGFSSDGTGVLATTTNRGVALAVDGKANFSRSGLLTVPAGQNYATVSGVSLTSASLVLATVQSTGGNAYVKQAVPNVAGSSFTVYLDKSHNVPVPVAWFIVN